MSCDPEIISVLTAALEASSRMLESMLRGSRSTEEIQEQLVANHSALRFSSPSDVSGGSVVRSAARLPKLPPELYEHYPAMSAQSHAAAVQDYARRVLSRHSSKRGSSPA